MTEIGLAVPLGPPVAHSMDEAREVGRTSVGCPLIVRPSVHPRRRGRPASPTTAEEFETVAAAGLRRARPIEILIEQSVEAGLEGVRARGHARPGDNCVVICSIENFDPMGVHTGDSITVAPPRHSPTSEYQVDARRRASRCIREIGVETGGSNIQFAVDPRTGEQVVIEMNPRVSRSSALASKATGFPIAKIAAKLAVGYTLDEIPNDITGGDAASFEPTIDYVVKVPRWAFEKFPGSAEPTSAPR